MGGAYNAPPLMNDGSGKSAMDERVKTIFVLASFMDYILVYK